MTDTTRPAPPKGEPRRIRATGVGYIAEMPDGKLVSSPSLEALEQQLGIAESAAQRRQREAEAREAAAAAIRADATARLTQVVDQLPAARQARDDAWAALLDAARPYLDAYQAWARASARADSLRAEESNLKYAATNGATRSHEAHRQPTKSLTDITAQIAQRQGRP